MPGIGVISNRNARLNRLNPELKDQLAFIIGNDGEVSSTSSLSDVYKAVEVFRRIGIDIIAISGGDGTAHRTMEILLDVYGGQRLPPVLLLPTGTQNMVPRSFGIEGSGLANLLLAVARYRHNIPMRCLRRNLLKVNGHTSFMFGTGVAARFMSEYYRIGDTTPKGATILVTRLVADAAVSGKLSRKLLRSTRCTITADGVVVADDAAIHTCFASFVERLPLHFMLFPQCGREAGRFEIAYSDLPPLEIAREFPHILRGSASPMKSVKRQLCATMDIRLAEPEPFTLDGELYDPTDHFVITAGPEVDFLVPALQFAAEDKNLRYTTAGPWSMRYLL